MAPDMRFQDLKKLENSLESVNKEQSLKYEPVMKLLEGYGQKLESTRTNHEIKLDELKNIINGSSFQHSSFLQKLQLPIRESSAHIKTHSAQNLVVTMDIITNLRRFLNLSETSQVLMVMMFTSGFISVYFEIEEILEADKLKLATYYLDGMELYWHQNFTSMRD
jgi:hypothetical protein